MDIGFLLDLKLFTEMFVSILPLIVKNESFCTIKLVHY